MRIYDPRATWIEGADLSYGVRTRMMVAMVVADVLQKEENLIG
jgi:hypothetical protein